MAQSKLQIKTTSVKDQITVTAKILTDSYLPTAVFIYHNTESGELGEFFGVCNKAELQRIKVWDGAAPVTLFGNKFVRHTECVKVMGLKDDVDSFIATLTLGVQELSTAMQVASTTTKIVNIT